MVKRIFSVVLAVIIILSISTFAVNATQTTKIYFEVPENWENFNYIYCHIWEYGGENLAPWQGRKERCSLIKDNLYEYDTATVGGLSDDTYYGVIFSSSEGDQTFDLVMSSECLGLVAYTEENVYVSPQDIANTVLPAFWRGVDPSLYGPALYISGFGEIHGTCIIPGKTAVSVLKDFIDFNLETALKYNDKDYVTMINELGAELGLDEYGIAQAVQSSSQPISWDFPENFDPTLPQQPDMVPPQLDVEITSPTEPEQEYGDVTYYVYLKTPQKIENIQAIVTYDTNVLEYVSCCFPNIKEPFYHDDGKGNLRFNSSNVTEGMDFTEETVLVKVEFKKISEASAEVDFVIEEMYEYFGDPYFIDSTQLNEAVEIRKGICSSIICSKPVEDVTGSTDIPEENADIVHTGNNNLHVVLFTLVIGAIPVVILRKKSVC